MMSARQHFYFLPTKPIATGDSVYAIVDANVLKTLLSMGIKGFNGNKASHMQAANMVRWMNSVDVECVNLQYAALECSGFHTGGVNSYELVRQTLFCKAITSMDGDTLEAWLASGESGETWVDYEKTKDLFEFTVADAYKRLPQQFGPNYACCLQMQLNERQKVPPREAMARIVEVLTAINFVPIEPWLASLYLYYGSPRTRQMVRDRLLKLRSKDSRGAILSAAWDLSYLADRKLLMLGAQTARGAAANVVLITDDKALAEFAGLFSPLLGGFEYDQSVLLSSAFDEVSEIHNELTAARAEANPTCPSLETIMRVARPLEAELGLPELSMQAPEAGVAIQPDLRIWRALVGTIGVDGEDLLHELVRIREMGDALVHGIFLCQGLIDDNAKARGRSRSESTKSVTGALRAELASQDSELVGESLIMAAMIRDEWTTNAYLQRIEIVDTYLYGPCLIYMTKFLHYLLEDTSGAYDEPLEKTKGRLLGKLETVQKKWDRAAPGSD